MDEAKVILIEVVEADREDIIKTEIKEEPEVLGRGGMIRQVTANEARGMVISRVDITHEEVMKNNQGKEAIDLEGVVIKIADRDLADTDPVGNRDTTVTDILNIEMAAVVMKTEDHVDPEEIPENRCVMARH